MIALKSRKWIILFLCIGSALNAQSTDSTFTVDSIAILGNRKTKSEIILRELTFKKGDTINNWSYHKEQSRKQLINLFLFNEIKLEHNGGLVLVMVTERWYFWPIPIIDYADRNFNQWWLTKDVDRLIYGVDMEVYNMRGRNETMVLEMIAGYTRSISFSYKVPYFNKKQTWGAQFTAGYNDNREVWFKTINDKVAFFNDDDKILIKRKRTELAFTHRKKFFSYHNFYTGYRQFNVSDTIVDDDVNRSYLLYGMNVQKEFYGGYQFVFDKRDYKGFPLNGHLLKLNAEYSVFKVPVEPYPTLMLKAGYSRYFNIKGDWFGSFHAGARMYYNSALQYTHAQALGYGKDYLRGYELNVIDGNNFLLGKAELKYRFLERKYKFADNVRNYEELPVALYLSGFYDAGYVVNHNLRNATVKENLLPNSFQNGFGAGLNVVMFYDYCMRIEYSADKHLQSRFYLSFVASM